MDNSAQTSSDQHIHEHQKAVIDRLSRIEGHVQAIKRMVEEGTECPEVLVQISAVRAALNGVGHVIRAGDPCAW